MHNYKSKHGFRFISKIPIEDAQLLHETWNEYADKQEAKENDRAENITYSHDIGKIVLSLTSGTLVIHSNQNEDSVKRFIGKWIGKNAYTEFVDTLRISETGVHFTRNHGTISLPIQITKPGTLILTISARQCRKYADIHVKVPPDMADIKVFERVQIPDTYNGIRISMVGTEIPLTPTIRAKRKYLQDRDILHYVTIKGSVTLKDAKEFNVSQSAFYRRLEKLRRDERISRIGKYPATYIVKPSEMVILQNSAISQRPKRMLDPIPS